MIDFRAVLHCFHAWISGCHFSACVRCGRFFSVYWYRGIHWENQFNGKVTCCPGDTFKQEAE